MTNKIYYEDDKIGHHKVIEQPNGIKIRLLKEPSDWYKKKQAKNAEKAKADKIVSDEKAAREKLIAERMRDIAIRELESEGKLK